MTNSLVFTTDTDGNLAKLCCIFHVTDETPCVKVKVESVLSCQDAANVPPSCCVNVNVLVVVPDTAAYTTVSL